MKMEANSKFRVIRTLTSFAPSDAFNAPPLNYEILQAVSPPEIEIPEDNYHATLEFVYER